MAYERGVVVAERTGPEAEPPYVLEDQIGFKLRLAYQKNIEIFALALPEITPMQFAVLAKMQEMGTLSQNRLGRLVAMDAATIKGVIDRLRLRGLVETVPSATDRRRLEVSLTDEGAALIAALAPRAAQVSRQTLRKLKPREAAQLLDLLDRLVE